MWLFCVWSVDTDAHDDDDKVSQRVLLLIIGCSGRAYMIEFIILFVVCESVFVIWKNKNEKKYANITHSFVVMIDVNQSIQTSVEALSRRVASLLFNQQAFANTACVRDIPLGIFPD